MASTEKHILLSNDDGIDSPGLWAAAEALSDLGHVTVAAPRDFMSAIGRGYQVNSDGMLTKRQVIVHDQAWDVYAVGGSPAQSILHGILELSPKKPDLVVAGINFGENLGYDLTLSGTVGAAIEGASLGIPGLAVSQQVITENLGGIHADVDFSIAAYFTKFFAERLLKKQLPEDVHVVNVVVPFGATRDTPWKVAPLANKRHFTPRIVRKGNLDGESRFRPQPSDQSQIQPDNDIHTIHVEKLVSVTPISINLTSRVSLSLFEELLRSK